MRTNDSSKSALEAWGDALDIPTEGIGFTSGSNPWSGSACFMALSGEQEVMMKVSPKC